MDQSARNGWKVNNNDDESQYLKQQTDVADHNAFKLINLAPDFVNTIRRKWCTCLWICVLLHNKNLSNVISKKLRKSKVN